MSGNAKLWMFICGALVGVLAIVITIILWIQGFFG